MTWPASDRAASRPPWSLGDGAVAALAGAVGVGAWWSPAVPLAVALLAMAVALGCRRAALLVLAAGLLAAALGHRAWAATAPLPAGPWSGEARLVSDPEPIASGTRAFVDIGGARVEAVAFGGPSRRLAPRLAGEVVRLEGRIRAPPAFLARYLATQHVRGRLDVRSVGPWRSGAPPLALANSLRRLVERGAEPLPEAERSLLVGLLFGDDRHQGDAQRAAFEAAGLTHLLAVSGQNVAFVLLAVSPLLLRLRLRGRFVVTVAVLVFFAILTRYEPSVLRATAMAGTAALAATLGRPASGARVLAIAVAALVLVDPLLAHSLAFQLSVAASAGILVLAPPLARAVPGPRWLAGPLTVTVAAQAATAPLLVGTFGGVPLAGVPANLAAEPAAAAVMGYGLVAGPLAGLLPAPLAALVHLPTRLLLGWVGAVAQRGAALPLPMLGWRGLALATILGGCAALVGLRWRRRAAGSVTFVRPPGDRPNRWR